jgi:hypothetical protein
MNKAKEDHIFRRLGVIRRRTIWISGRRIKKKSQAYQ